MDECRHFFAPSVTRRSETSPTLSYLNVDEVFCTRCGETRRLNHIEYAPARKRRERDEYRQEHWNWGLET